MPIAPSIAILAAVIVDEQEKLRLGRGRAKSPSVDARSLASYPAIGYFGFFNYHLTVEHPRSSA